MKSLQPFINVFLVLVAFGTASFATLFGIGHERD